MTRKKLLGLSIKNDVKVSWIQYGKGYDFLKFTLQKPQFTLGNYCGSLDRCSVTVRCGFLRGVCLLMAHEPCV